MSNYIDVSTCARLSCVMTREEYDISPCPQTICFDLAQDHARDEGIEVPDEAEPGYVIDNVGAALLDMFESVKAEAIFRT